MFDLEQAIADWRKQMSDGGIKTSEVLDELESHLREDVGQQVQSGVNEQTAFKVAAIQIGQASTLKTEFDKGNGEKQMKRVLIISAGVVGVLVGVALVMPTVARYRHQGTMDVGDVVAFALGIVLTLGGIATAFCGGKLRKTQV